MVSSSAKLMVGCDAAAAGILMLLDMTRFQRQGGSAGGGGPVLTVRLSGMNV